MTRESAETVMHYCEDMRWPVQVTFTGKYWTCDFMSDAHARDVRLHLNSQGLNIDADKIGFVCRLS